MLDLRRVKPALWVAAALCAALPASASGATTIGSDLVPDPVQAPSGPGATAPRTVATTFLPRQQFSSPRDGVVVRWRVRSAGTDLGGNPVRLKVIRRADSGAFTGINTSATETVPASLVPTTFAFQTRQAIGYGDLIALDISGPNGNFIVQTAIQAGLHLARWQPMPLLDGQTRTPDNDPSFDYGEHTFNADIEPDVDADGFGDETQDDCPTDPSTQGECPPDTDPPETEITKGAPNKLDKSKVKFTFTSDEPGSTFECKLDKKAFKPCTSPRKVKRLDEGKHKFKVRAIDAAGNVDPSAAKDKFKVVD
jgi:hypothetical protein